MQKTFISLFYATILFACQPQEKPITALKNFSKEYVQPTNGYAQMVVVKDGATKTLHISGQIGEGETLEAQMRDALNRMKVLLESQDAGFEDLVKINTYIVNYQQEDLDTFRGVRQEIFGDSISPASTLVGVQSLALPNWKIEIDGVAVVAL
jgi:enamine deaminase RidA (YjgF/YER057c/UK114 family)